MIYILIICLIITAELIIKNKIEKSDKLENKEIFGGRIVINSLHNYGVSFGAFYDKPLFLRKFLSFFLGIGLIIYIFMLFFKRLSFMYKLALSFVLGGGISNLVDRYKRGYVFDYFSFVSRKFKKLNKMVFNLADMFVFLGAIIFAVNYFRSKGD